MSATEALLRLAFVAAATYLALVCGSRIVGIRAEGRRLVPHRQSRPRPLVGHRTRRSRTLPGIAAAMAEQWGGPINQCDGCRRGLPVVRGIHRGTGYDMISCTADRYAA